MNREDIIRMAREVGFVAYGEDAGEYRIPTPAFHCRLERFAALVAAAERKRIESTPWGAGKEWIARAVEAEREACAKVCEDFYQGLPPKLTVRGYLEDIARAIRARGETK